MYYQSLYRQFAMLRIQRALRERRISDAVGLYRLCRDIWYSNDIFGTQNMIPEEEFVELRNIFYANLTEVEFTPFDRRLESR